MYSRKAIAPRDADGERFIHSAVQCEGGEVEAEDAEKRDGARAP